jgi:thioredoxin-like negative regulator of GroEL
MKLAQLTDRGLEELILRGAGVSVVAFVYPDGMSIPCKHFRFELESFAGHTRLPVYSVSALENPAAADSLKIEAVPTTLLLRDGQIVGKWEGPYSALALGERIAEALKKPSI